MVTAEEGLIQSSIYQLMIQYYRQIYDGFNQVPRRLNFDDMLDQKQQLFLDY